jgi:hypothetical protein
MAEATKLGERDRDKFGEGVDVIAIDKPTALAMDTRGVPTDTVIVNFNDG